MSITWQGMSIGAMALALWGMACSSGATPSLTTPTVASTVQPSASPEPTPALKVGGKVGNRAPDFTVTLGDGGSATLASLLEEEKPLLLYFFTTW